MIMRQKAADQRGRIQFERQVHAEREDQGGHAEHFHGDGDGRAGAEENVRHRLAAHEAFHQRLHDGGLGGGKHHAQVAGRRLAELEGLRQHDDGQPGCDGCGHQRRGTSPSAAPREWSRASSLS